VQYLGALFLHFLNDAGQENLNILLQILRFLTDFLEFSNENQRLSMQNLFDRVGLTHTLLDMLCGHEKFDYRSNYSCRKVFRCIIVLMSALLHKGNAQAQNSCYEYFT
jgi:hypothetical protein